MGEISHRPWVKWYKTAAWARLRKRQLQREPLCVFCKKRGLVDPADTVDHIKPHRGDMALFFDINNLQSLSKSCHSSQKQRLEKSGEFGCDESGMTKEWA